MFQVEAAVLLAIEALVLNVPAVSSSFRGDVLDGLGPPSQAPQPAPAPAAPPVSPRDVSSRAIADALAENDGNIEKTWRALGLASRHVLTRLMTKHGLRRPSPGGGDGNEDG